MVPVQRRAARGTPPCREVHCTYEYARYSSAPNPNGSIFGLLLRGRFLNFGSAFLDPHFNQSFKTREA